MSKINRMDLKDFCYADFWFKIGKTVSLTSREILDNEI